MVNVIVTQTRLYGVHEVKIMEGEHKNCYAALIVDSRAKCLIYKGLILNAKVLRVHGSFIDMVLYEQNLK